MTGSQETPSTTASQAAIAAAALFTSHPAPSSTNNANKVPSINGSADNKQLGRQENTIRTSKLHKMRTTVSRNQPSMRPLQTSSSVDNLHADKANGSRDYSIYNTPTSQVPQSATSISSKNNKWNDINNSSSSTALAAASSIAKRNPEMIISNAASPKLLRKQRVRKPPLVPQTTNPTIIANHLLQSEVSLQAPTSIVSTPSSSPKSLSNDSNIIPSHYPISTTQIPSHIKKLDLNTSVISVDPPMPSATTAPDNTAPNQRLRNSMGTSNSIYQQQSANVPSQQLVFRTTLRDDKKSKNKNSKSGFNENKPWKNHERETLNMITSDEKKRYEGVFAANKSSYLDLDPRLVDAESLKLSNFVNTYTPLNERIHSLIVYEIWTRSKIDKTTLSKIWSLVLDDRKRRWIKAVNNGSKEWLVEIPKNQIMTNTNGSRSSENVQDDTREQQVSYNLLDIDRNMFDDSTLTYEEFIVGMWLIDQCLYGRKLPKSIPVTVWETIGIDWSQKYQPHHHHHHQNLVGDLVSKGIKTGKSTKREVFKKVIGI